MNRYPGGDSPQKATSSVPQYTEEQMAASILAAGGGRHLVALFFQRLLQRPTNQMLIVND